MLFRTVYGPELQAIYAFIAYQSAQGHSPSRQTIHQAFLSGYSNNEMGSTQSIDDALSFLLSAGLVQERSGNFAATDNDTRFDIQLLQAMRRLETGRQAAIHPTDALYSLLLSELFVRPNCLFLPDLHGAANELRQVQEVGGLSREKIQAWKRVMTYLGVGRRVGSSWMCAYSPDLIAEIIQTWEHQQGTLQSLLEDCLARVLPFESQGGDLADCIAAPLEYLAQQGRIALYPLQDSPGKPYFGARRWRGIERKRA